MHEFRSEKWGELYSRRVDEMIGVLKSRGRAGVLGRAAVDPRRRARRRRWSTSTISIAAAPRRPASIYVDIWDGFVDDAGNFNNYGPDFEGQTRRLRSGDGAHFTRAGARKLAHYVEREIRRVHAGARDAGRDAAAAGARARTRRRRRRRRAGTAAASDREPGHVADRAEGRGRCAARRDAGARQRRPNPVATRVLVKGEPIEAPAGRADDFVWPRRDVVTATGVLPPDPVEPADARRSHAGGAAPRPARGRAAASAPRPRREQQQQNNRRGWGWFAAAAALRDAAAAARLLRRLVRRRPVVR